MVKARIQPSSNPQALNSADIARIFGQAEFLARDWKCTRCRAVYAFEAPSLPPDGGCRCCGGICWETDE